MSAKAHDAMPISERELGHLTRDMDDMHHALMPTMDERAAAWAERNRGTPAGASGTPGWVTSRRHFLVGSGAAVLGGLVLAACGGTTSKAPASSPTTLAGGGDVKGDLAVAALAAALENLAVSTYQAGIDAATAGTLAPVPPAVATFVSTAQQHHRDHVAAWNSVLTGAGRGFCAFANVKDVGGLARLALSLENTAAATYQNGISILGETSAIQVAASIQPVELQHAAILNFVLGNAPVPDAFTQTTLARTPDDQIAPA